MPEYIYEIEEDQSDESEIFIGWIRRHSKQLIRCKGCKHFIRDITCVGGHYDGCDAWTDNGNEIMVAEDDFCSYAERKEE